MNELGAPRTIQVIVHAKVFDLVDGWNEVDNDVEAFHFEDHAFNFDYLLHLSGINYLIHPEDIDQVIMLTKTPDKKIIDFHFRFINRSGEMKILHGKGRLISLSHYALNMH